MTTASRKYRDMLDETPDHEPEPPRPLFREVPPAEPFPLDALGPVLGPAARAIHALVLSPPAICAQAVLGAAALAVQGHADIALPTGQTRPISLYLASVAESGERKSSTDAWALKPIRMREEALRAAYKEGQTAYKNEKAAWECMRNHAKTVSKEAARNDLVQALAALGPEPEPPLAPMLVFDEPTFEGLIKYMVGAHPSLGVFSAEGGQFVGGHGMKDENKLMTAAGLSSLWDGQPVRRLRAGDGSLFLPGRRLSAHLMVQPGVGDAFLSDPILADQGLLSRFLTVVPETTAGTRWFREPDAAAEADIARYTSRILGILDGPLPLVPHSRNELSPCTLRLAPEAHRMLVGFYDQVEGQVGPGGPLEPVRPLANKLAEHAARLAAVMNLVEDVEASEVSGKAMADAIVLAQYYLGEALRLAASAQIPPDLREAQKLLDWWKGKWGEEMVSIPDICQYGPNSKRTAVSARKFMTILESHGHAVQVTEGATIRGTRRKEVWCLVTPPGG